MRTRKSRDPLGPLEFMVSLTVGLFALTVLLSLLLSAIGVGRTHWAGTGQVCVQDTSGSSVVSGTQVRAPIVWGARPGVSTYASTVTLCTGHPSAGSRRWFIAHEWARPAFGGGLLLLIWWAIRRARRYGFFARPTADGLRALGWSVIVASTGAEVVRYLADVRIFHALVPDGGLPRSDLPVSAWGLLTGFGLLALGSILRHAVLLQEEVDATV